MLFSALGAQYTIRHEINKIIIQVWESKGFCDDIREGKFTFPFVHAINSRPNDKRLMGNYTFA